MTSDIFEFLRGVKPTKSEKMSNKELMERFTKSINELSNEYAVEGVYLVKCERNDKGDIKCWFKIIGEAK